MVRTTLRLTSFLMVLMGIATLVPRWVFANGAEWYGIAQIVIGVIAFAVSYSKKS